MKHLSMAVLFSIGILLVLSMRLAFSADFNVTVVRVVDGDTFAITLPLPPPLDKAKVRIRGIDTPELAPKAKCVEEGEQAKKASAFLKSKLTGKSVKLTKPQWDKFGGRIDSDVFLNGKSLNEQILLFRDESGKPIALPYTGGKRPDWCAFLTQ